MKFARLAAARREGRPFPAAWADALYAALAGLPPEAFREWADVMLATWEAWEDAYAARPTPGWSLIGETDPAPDPGVGVGSGSVAVARGRRS